MNKTNKNIKKKIESKIEHRFKSGALSSTIFSKELETTYGMKKVFTISFQKAYPVKDDKGKVTEWKYTSSFNKNDVAGLNALIRSVTEFLYIDEDEEIRETDDDIAEETDE